MPKLIFLLLFCALGSIAGYAQPGSIPAQQGITLSVSERYLNFPVRTGAPLQRVECFVNGKQVREFLIELDADRPDFWVHLDVGAWKGQAIELRIAEKNALRNLEGLYQSAKPAGAETFYKESLRPAYHYAPVRGRLNDPNGLVYYAGEWHMFHQHNPYGWAWNNMTWNHLVSKDLIHWEDLGAALHPDSLGTIYSGSAIVDKDNVLGLQKGKNKTLVVFYTYAPNANLNWAKDLPRTQAMATSTDLGRSWVKYPGNPIVKNYFKSNRDPKVVWDDSGQQWVMALYTGDKDLQKAYQLLTSKDLVHWKDVQLMPLPNDNECPDIYPIQVQGSNERKWVFSGAHNVYLVGEFAQNQFQPIAQPAYMDQGPNLYAAQTYFNAPEGRMVQIGWIKGNFPGMPFNQQMSFPRELKLFKTKDSYQIKSMPVKEIESLYTAGYFRYPAGMLREGDDPTAMTKGQSYVLDAVIDVAASDAAEFGFYLDGFELNYSLKKKILTITPGNGKRTEIPLEPEQGKVSFKILADVASMEVFANEGVLAATFFYLPPVRTGSIKTLLKGKKIMLEKLEVHQIQSVWQK